VLIKNKFYIILLILIYFSFYELVICEVSKDNIISTTKKNLISILENKDNKSINYILICNKYVNINLNDTRFDTLEISINNKLINLSSKDYSIIIDDSVCVVLKYNLNTILVTKIKDKIKTISEYFSFKYITNDNVINIKEENDKFIINLKYNLNTIIPKKNNEMKAFVNKLGFIEQLDFEYYNFEEKVIQNQLIFYKKNENNTNTKNALDFIYVGNKLKKEYEKFKIIK